MENTQTLVPALSNFPATTPNQQRLVYFRDMRDCYRVREARTDLAMISLIAAGAAEILGMEVPGRTDTDGITRCRFWYKTPYDADDNAQYNVVTTDSLMAGQPARLCLTGEFYYAVDFQVDE